VLYFAVPRPEEHVPVPMNDLWRNEITLMTSYGAGPFDLELSMKMLSSRRVVLNDMITHRLPFDEGGKGFKLVADANESIKVIIEAGK
jgi:L-iditol 2-dehydrogenase